MSRYGDGTTYGSGARYGEASIPIIKMSKFKRDLKKAPIPTKTSRGTEIITACTGNAALGDVTEPLGAFSTANGSLDTTAGQVTANETAHDALITHQGSDERAWDAALEVLLGTIESNTKGAKEPMQTTTVPVTDPGTGAPAGAIEQVQNVHVSIGDMPLEHDLQWDTMNPRPKLFTVQSCDDPYDESRMREVATPSASRVTITNATPGKKWYRVAAKGSGGKQGPWSNPATGTAI